MLYYEIGDDLYFASAPRRLSIASMLTSYRHNSDNLYGTMASAHRTFKCQPQTLTRALTLGSSTVIGGLD